MPSKQKMRVLVVEDNVDCAATMAELMERLGFEAQVADNGAEALQRARTFLPDVILLDIGLPVMNGYEVAQRLRLLPDASSTLIVAVTGYGSREDIEQARTAGIDIHVTKPVDVALLNEMLDSYRQGLGG